MIYNYKNILLFILSLPFLLVSFSLGFWYRSMIKGFFRGMMYFDEIMEKEMILYKDEFDNRD